MMKFSNCGYGYIVLSSLVFVLGLVSVLIAVLLSLLLPDPAFFQDHKEVYISTEFNPSNNYTKRVFVRIGRILKDEYVSYFTPDGKYILITSLGNLNYECTGTCRCLDENYRRAQHSVWVNSLYFIVTASSLALAVYYAQHFFFDSCYRDYSPMCSNISSETNDCTMVSADEISEFGKSTYKCMGFCTNVNNAAKMFEEALRDGTMSKKQAKGMIKTLKGKYREYEEEFACEKEFFEEIIRAETRIAAIEYFTNDYLLEYCVNYGYIGVVYNKPEEIESVCYPDMKKVDCVKVL